MIIGWSHSSLKDMTIWTRVHKIKVLLAWKRGSVLATKVSTVISLPFNSCWSFLKFQFVYLIIHINFFGLNMFLQTQLICHGKLCSLLCVCMCGGGEEERQG